MPSASETARAPRTGVVIVLRVVGLLVLAAALLAFPSMAANAFILSVGVVIMSYAVLATSWNFVGGLTGYISLGHAAYSGLGGYATGLLVIHTDINPWFGLFVGALIVTAIAVPVGIASLRVRGASFVIVSIAFVLIMQLVAQSWRSFTGGQSGLRVPRPFGPEVLRPEQHERFYYLFVALLAVALLVWWLIDRSRFGIGLKAIREDEDKAQALGVPTFYYKLAAFIISAFFTALGGGLYALWFGYLDPVFQFSILIGAYMVLMSLLGGIRSLLGPLVGALIVGYAIEYFKSEYGDTQFHLVATGLLLGAVVLFMPDGIIPAITDLVKRFRPQAASIREQTQAELAEERRTGHGRTGHATDRDGNDDADKDEPVTEGTRS